MKIFGTGWAKTGTTTLGTCFEILGYHHQPQDLTLVADVGRNDLSRIMNRVANHDTFEDWPWLLLYKQLDEAFPGSKFVLTWRQPEKWIKSYANMLDKQGEATPQMNEIRQILYGLPFPDVTEQQLLDRYERHNQAVRSHFADRPDDLLIVNWEEGDGWESLCNFLGRPVPDTPFPHANKGKYQPVSAIEKLRAFASRHF